jgi:glycogen debranching enzyme
MAIFELTNPDLTTSTESVPKQTLNVTWKRLIDSRAKSLRDAFCFTNRGVTHIDLPFELRFSAKFEDIFEVRGLHPARIGKARPPKWRGQSLEWVYDGADRIQRSVRIQFSQTPHRRTPQGATLKLQLRPGETREVKLIVSVSQSDEPHPQHSTTRKGGTRTEPMMLTKSDEWVQRHTEIESDSDVLNAAMDRSIRDLRVLRTELDGHEFFSAGLPWYAALFGRDSIISAYQMLAYEPSIAAETLRLLARYQGKNERKADEQEPGKILHELRRGELAHLKEIPQTPYYGSVDSTPLFLILVAAHAHWTGSLELFHELRFNIEFALDWMNSYADISGNGYVGYERRTDQGLGNQGWKDSGDAITNKDGSLAQAPICLVEVQGYVYRAKTEIAKLCAWAGDSDTARQLQTEALELRKRFHRDFWIDNESFLPLALQKGGRPAAVISSNPGHALWCGIVANARARRIASRMMEDDMFSGWGVRTLSSLERRYNPVGYHLGTVWPHDNSLIVAGLRRYGHDREACRIFDGMLRAAQCFPHYRLPEVLCGFSRGEFSRPVQYPVACHPQAWASGAIPLMLTELLGLRADALGQLLIVENPVLPESIHSIEVRGLHVGRARADLSFSRNRGGTGPLKVRIQTRQNS